MSPNEKLAILARSWIADVKVAAARERAEAIHERVRAVDLARERFDELYGHPVGTDDVGAYLALIVEFGGGEIRREDLDESLAIGEELVRRSREALSAAQAIVDAQAGIRPDVPTWQWVGVAEDEFNAAFQTAIDREMGVIG